MPNDTARAQDGPEKVDVKLSATPRMQRRHQRTADAPHAAEHGDGEDPADVFPPHGGLDRANDNEQRTGEARRGHPQSEGNGFDLDRVRSHEAERQAVLGDTHDGLAVEGFGEKKIQCEGQEQSHHARHTQA